MYSSNTPKFNNIDGSNEKTLKYGSPQRTFILTAIIITLLSAVLIVIYSFEQKPTGITAEYSRYYPAKTFFYVDADLSNDKAVEFNKLTGFNIKDTADLLNRTFNADYQKYKSRIFNKLISESFGESFSFGTWKDASDTTDKKRMLFIIPVKREGKVNRLINDFLNKKGKLFYHSAKGYKIITLEHKKGAYLLRNDKFYLADSRETLVYIIKNHFLGKSASLLTSKKFKKSLPLLAKERIGTVLISEPDIFLDEAKDYLPKNYFQFSEETVNFLKSFAGTAVSIHTDKKMLYFKSYSPVNLNQAEIFKNAFQDVLNIKQKEAFIPVIPDDTVISFSLKNLKETVDFISAVKNGSSHNSSDKIFGFSSVLGNLQFKQIISNLLNNEASLYLMDYGYSSPKNAFLAKVDLKSAETILKFSDFIALQTALVKPYKVIYRGNELKFYKNKKNYKRFLYGKVKADYFVFGESKAVKSLIDCLEADKPNLCTKKIEKFQSHALPDASVFAYLNVEKSSRYFVNYRQNILFSKFKRNVDDVLFSFKPQSEILEGSVEFSLK